MKYILILFLFLKQESGTINKVCLYQGTAKVTFWLHHVNTRDLIRLYSVNSEGTIASKYVPAINGKQVAYLGQGEGGYCDDLPVIYLEINSQVVSEMPSTCTSCGK